MGNAGSAKRKEGSPQEEVLMSDAIPRDQAPPETPEKPEEQPPGLPPPSAFKKSPSSPGPTDSESPKKVKSSSAIRQQRMLLERNLMMERLGASHSATQLPWQVPEASPMNASQIHPRSSNSPGLGTSPTPQINYSFGANSGTHALPTADSLKARVSAPGSPDYFVDIKEGFATTFPLTVVPSASSPTQRHPSPHKIGLIRQTPQVAFSRTHSANVQRPPSGSESLVKTPSDYRTNWAFGEVVESNRGLSDSSVDFPFNKLLKTAQSLKNPNKGEVVASRSPLSKTEARPKVASPEELGLKPILMNPFLMSFQEVEQSRGRVQK